MKRTKYERIIKPYSDCLIDSDTKPSDINSIYYNKIIDSGKIYKSTDCYNLCYQTKLLDKCSCLDPNANYFNLFNSSINSFCNLLIIDQSDYEYYISINKKPIKNDYECMKKLYEIDNLVEECTKACPLECSGKSFVFTSNYAYYPSNSYQKYLADKYQILNHFDIGNLQGKILKLNIFYESISIEITSESKAVTYFTLFSNVGGALGLLMGFCVLTLFEFVELLIKIGIHLYQKKFSW